MNKLIWGSLVCFCLSTVAHAKNNYGTMFPKNNRYIGLGLVNEGIEEADFNKVLAKIIDIYTPIVANHGYKLQFNLLWEDGTVNSDTYTSGDRWIINSYGGLARYKGMTMDGYAVVACHELGHHLGGAPQFSDGDGMSIEGESDYFTGKCMRHYFASDDNVSLMSGVTVDPMVVTQCSAAFLDNAEMVATCERNAMAGFVVADVLRDLEGASPIAFNTPDKTVVGQTNEEHPAAQCRLDTYLEAAVCEVSADIEFSNTDETVGACMTGNGARSHCWFHPSN